MRPTPPVPTRRLRRVEYECLVERGLFEPDDRIELIDGLLVVREPPSAPHLVALQLTQRALQRAFGDGWNIRPAGPVALDEDSEPEPDLAAVPGAPRDYVDYWIVNLVDRVLETRRRPITSDAAPTAGRTRRRPCWAPTHPSPRLPRRPRRFSSPTCCPERRLSGFRLRTA